MVEVGAERRLAAIVAVDVAGYSRLMGGDEQGTLSLTTVDVMERIDEVKKRRQSKKTG